LFVPVRLGKLPAEVHLGAQCTPVSHSLTVTSLPLHALREKKARHSTG